MFLNFILKKYNDNLKVDYRKYVTSIFFEYIHIYIYIHAWAYIGQRNKTERLIFARHYRSCMNRTGTCVPLVQRENSKSRNLTVDDAAPKQGYAQKPYATVRMNTHQDGVFRDKYGTLRRDRRTERTTGQEQLAWVDFS